MGENKMFGNFLFLNKSRDRLRERIHVGQVNTVKPSEIFHASLGARERSVRMFRCCNGRLTLQILTSDSVISQRKHFMRINASWKIGSHTT